MSSGHDESIRTRIWLEEPEADNPFVTRAAYCHGYDVYGEMVGHARWSDMLFLLFRGEAPTRAQADLLEALAVALANAGPRDPAVHAAMCAGVVGSPAASALMAALAVGAGQFNGAREIWTMMHGWARCGDDLAAWRDWMREPADPASIWPAGEHPAGFDPNSDTAALPVCQTLSRLAALHADGRLGWLAGNRQALENVAGLPLSLAGVAATCLHDLGFTPEQGEMLYLLLRLPGAAAHALEQQGQGYKNFPFFRMELGNEPAKEGK